MRQLSYINFPGLSDFLWTKESFKTMHDQSRYHLNNYIQAKHGYGILWGCKVTYEAGLTVRVSEGLVYFSNNNEIVYYPGGTIALDAADVAEDRYDRLELAYSAQNGLTGSLASGAVVTYEIVKGCTIEASKGANGGGVPATVAGQISLASVKISAGAVSLSDDVIDMSHGLRAVSQDVRKHEAKFTLANERNDASVGGGEGSGNTELTNLYFDPALIDGAIIEYFSQRKDESQDKKCFGRLSFVYDSVEEEWRSEDKDWVDDTGLFIGITSDGKAFYQTSDFSAIDYQGELKIINITYIYKE